MAWKWSYPVRDRPSRVSDRLCDLTLNRDRKCKGALAAAHLAKRSEPRPSGSVGYSFSYNEFNQVITSFVSPERLQSPQVTG